MYGCLIALPGTAEILKRHHMGLIGACHGRNIAYIPFPGSWVRRAGPDLPGFSLPDPKSRPWGRSLRGKGEMLGLGENRPYRAAAARSCHQNVKSQSTLTPRREEWQAPDQV
jgi:hypothetical protein